MPFNFEEAHDMMKILKKILVLFLVGVIGFSSYNLFLIYKQNQDERKALDAINSVIDKKDDLIRESNITIPKLSLQTITHDELMKMKEVNKDVVGYLQFDSGLISEPVVQTTNNEYYLYHDINHGYNDFGTVFMNKDNTLDDMNLVMYGHAGVYAGTQKFSNLNTLLNNYDEYSKNSFLTFYTDKDVRRYQISYIIQNRDLDAFNHQTLGFTEETFKDWLDFANSHTSVTSLNPLKWGDKFITLQTCIHGGGDDKVIVIAKEVWRGNYAN